MKWAFSVLFALFASASARPLADIKADSKLGTRLLSEARKLNNDDGEWTDTWLSGYSIKFQGCHHISQWNDDASDSSDVRIATKRLVRFRLCPSDSCNAKDSKGCSSNYGDYVIDLNTYLSYYFQAMATYQEFECGYLTDYVCACNGDEYCLYNCYKEHNMESLCMNYNPYDNNANGGNGNSFEVTDYLYCTKSNAQDANGNSLYLGPYCASQGGAIYMGAFTDEACSNYADTGYGATTYYTSMGSTLPYAAANIVNMDCVSCKEPAENNNGGNDANDADDVAEVCESLYTYAGKCESSLPYGTTAYPNTNACNYMEGIKIVRKDGTVVTADARANKTAAVFIGLFVVAFVLLGAYVYYLKTKLDRASINLAE